MQASAKTRRSRWGAKNHCATSTLPLDEGAGAHERITLFHGARGTGKTVMLNAVEDAARERGWHVFNETTQHGFTDRLVRAILKRVAELDEPVDRRKLKGRTLGPVGFQFEGPRSPEISMDLREAMTLLSDVQRDACARTGQRGTGLLITLDELHYQDQDEVRAFAAAVQHLVREDRDIAVAMAGLPSAVNRLLADPEGTNAVTFLRRTYRVDLMAVSEEDALRGLREPVIEAGGAWDEAALEKTARATGGYPFMIQLVGQSCFRAATDGRIGMDTVEIGIPAARRRLGQLVHEPALADLSDMDRTFLLAMAQDDGPSATGEIAHRMGVSAGYASTYRQRLLTAGMIQPAGYGYVDFTMPYMREHLRDHPAAMGLIGDHR